MHWIVLHLPANQGVQVELEAAPLQGPAVIVRHLADLRREEIDHLEEPVQLRIDPRPGFVEVRDRLVADRPESRGHDEGGSLLLVIRRHFPQDDDFVAGRHARVGEGHKPVLHPDA